MSTISTTISVGDDSAGVIAGLLSRFAKGQRVLVALTDEPIPPVQAPTLAELTARLDAARQKLPPSPWMTTEDALRDLREGERDYNGVVGRSSFILDLVLADSLR